MWLLKSVTTWANFLQEVPNAGRKCLIVFWVLSLMFSCFELVLKYDQGPFFTSHYTLSLKHFLLLGILSVVVEQHLSQILSVPECTLACVSVLCQDAVSLVFTI